MKPADFQYHRPRKIDEALSLLQEFGDEGKILAGGQSLMPLMNFRLAQPAHIIDINFIDGMDYTRRDKGVLKIGCLARQSRLLDSPIVRERCPLLAEALTYVGYEQIRNRGTLCGSLAHADPAAELPAVLLALDGFVTVGNLTDQTRNCGARFFQIVPDDIPFQRRDGVGSVNPGNSTWRRLVVYGVRSKVRRFRHCRRRGPAGA